MSSTIPHRARQALHLLGLAALSLTASGQAWAQSDFASVSTSANTHGLAGQGPYIDMPGAATSLARGLTSETSGPVVASATSGGVTSTVTLFGTATAPVDITHLGSVGASAKIESIRTQSNVAPFYQWTDASASAGFVDYLQLGTQAGIKQMVLTFQLNGSLTPNVPLQDYPHSEAASGALNVDFGVSTGQRHVMDSSFSEFAGGQTTERSQLFNGKVTSTGLFNATSGASDYTGVASSPGTYQITLGSGFFANPNATDLMLSFRLSTFVSLYAYAPFATDVMSVEADYAHTLQMTSINAYDAQGHDITDQAILGFASTVSVVPESGTSGMAAAGIAVLAGLGRRRRHAPLAS